MANFWKDLIYAPVSIMKGLRVTWTNLLRPKVTMFYPDERPSLAPRFRGVPALVTDGETGELKCVACGVCARACPDSIITITTMPGETKGKRNVLDVFSIDMSRCEFCAFCAESCPFEALEMSHAFELATHDRSGLILHKEVLARFLEPKYMTDEERAEAAAKAAAKAAKGEHKKPEKAEKKAVPEPAG
ncbi:MAG: NADH-quinone oxidoreductase subunit I [Armatimonadetes bacterium]|nr:NADH-quinone oxidoreductase subunit I [Armatimonadota bacterium]